MKTHRWLNLSEYGMKLVVVIHATGSRLLVVENGDNQPSAMRRLGYKRHESSNWYNPNSKVIAPKQYLREFPNAKLEELKESEIISSTFDTSGIEPEELESGSSPSEEFNPIGNNSRGQKVYETIGGDRFVSSDGVARIWENKETGTSSEIFLRSVNQNSHLSCIEGFIETRLCERDEQFTDPESFAAICGMDDMNSFYSDLTKSVRRRITARENQTAHEKFTTGTTLLEALHDTPTAAAIQTLTIALCGKQLMGTDRDLIGQRIRYTGLDKGTVNLIHSKGSQRVKKDDEFDIELCFAKSRRDAHKSINSLNSATRLVMAVKMDDFNKATEILKTTSELTSYEACAYFTNGNSGFLILSTIGNSGVNENVKPVPLTSFEELWTWTTKMSNSRAKAIEEARMGLDTEAEFTSAQSTLVCNDFQKPYASLSKSDRPTTMIPRDLDSATRQALNRIASSFEDVDKAMAREFEYTNSEFGSIFAPEQIDALALAIHAESRNRGFLIADGTGVGKGRPLAALIVRAVMQGKKVVFISERDCNLSDIHRDIKHINRLNRITPLVMNEGVKLIDEDTERPFETKSQELLVEALQTGGWPEGVDVVYATYSQFNRRIEDSPRSAWLDRAVDQNTVLIADEIHNAASGTSNTSANISMAINRAGSVFYSSATHAATSRMVAFYERLFPDDIDAIEMGRMIAKGGEPLQEVITSMLVADGVMVRRERDLSSIGFSQHIDTDRIERNKKYMDELAGVIAEMAAVSVDVAESVRAFNGNLARLRDGLEMRMIPFGAPLHSLTRFAMACLGAEFAADRAIAALQNNEKPIVMVDNTIQAILDECFQNGTFGPDFKAVIHRVLSQLTNTHMAKIQDADTEEMEPETTELMHRSIQQVRKIIDKLPNLRAYPIDVVKQRITDAGFSCGEITGRSLEVLNGAVVTRTDRNRTAIKNGFNNGRYDSLIINVSSSTGIDLHASNRFKDRRPRVFIELQAPQSVQRQVQAFGRISRRDEAVPPRIEFLSTGLPSEIRLAAMRNRRLRRMSATVTSNRDSAYLTKQIPDIINSVGDNVITKYAEMRPDLLVKLCLDPESLGKNQNSGNADEFAEEARKDVKHSANTFLSRLSLLATDVQETIIAELFSEYECQIAELEAKGENPLRPREIEGIVHLEKPVLFEGAVSGNSENSFDGPLFLHDAKIERIVKALDSETVMAAVEKGSNYMAEVNQAMDNLAQNRNLFLESYLSGGSRNVEEAIAHGDRKIIKMRNRMEDLSAALPNLTPGRSIEITTPDDTRTNAIITGIYVPKAGFEHMPHQYRVKLAVPGETSLKTYFVDTLLKMPGVAIRDNDGNIVVKSSPGLEGEDYDTVLESFDKATATRFVKAKFLMANIYRASRIATKHKAGSLVSFVDTNGVRHKGVIVRKGFEKKLAHLPMRVDGAEAIHAALVNKVGRINTSPGNERTGVTIQATGGNTWSLKLPRPRKRGEKTLWKSNSYRDLYLTGNVNDKGISTIIIDGPNQLRLYLEILEDAGHSTFFIDGKAATKNEISHDNNLRMAA